MSPGIRTLTDLSIACAYGDPDACDDPRCMGYDHMPEPEDTIWGVDDEDRSWLLADDAARRREDR